MGSGVIHVTLARLPKIPMIVERKSWFKLNPILLGVMFLWGFNFVALKLLFKDDLVSPATAALGRWLIMTAVLVAFCLGKGLSLRYPKGQTLRIHIQGFLAMGVYMVLFTMGMHHADPGVGAIVLGCSPVFTLLLAVLFRQERFEWPILVGTLLAFTGVTLVVFQSPNSGPGSSSFIGSLLIFLSAIVWAASAVVSKPLTSKVDPFVLTALTMPAGLLALLPFGWRDFIATDWAHLPALNWWMLVYFAVAAGALGFMGFYTGVKQSGAAGAMLYQYFVSPIAVFFNWLVFNQGLSIGQVAGFAVVITGVWFANRARNQALVSVAAEAA